MVAGGWGYTGIYEVQGAVIGGLNVKQLWQERRGLGHLAAWVADGPVEGAQQCCGGL